MCSIQNRFYNGWTHDHYITNVFGFCPAGTIVVATTNVPGCIHDSQVADWGNIYKKLSDVYEKTGGKCVVDSAFSKRRHDFLIKSAQSQPDDPVEMIINNEVNLLNGA